jgi:hypothetical protein
VRIADVTTSGASAASIQSGRRVIAAFAAMFVFALSGVGFGESEAGREQLFSWAGL